MVVHTYNPTYPKGKNVEDCDSMPAWVKNVSETSMSTNKPVVVLMPVGGICRMTVVQD
jgi:hypothetical protein